MENTNEYLVYLISEGFAKGFLAGMTYKQKSSLNFSEKDIIHLLNSTELKTAIIKCSLTIIEICKEKNGE